MDITKIVLIFLVAIIAIAVCIGLYINSNKEAGNNNKSKVIEGTVERFGYSTKTPKGWGYWVLKIKDQKDLIIIHPHQHKNHNEIALITKGDRLKIRCYPYNNGNEIELIASEIQNLDY